MTRRIEAEQATPAVAEHGEGPVWDASRGLLASVDMHRGDLLTVDLLRDRSDLAQVRRRHVGDLLAALRPRARGGWVVALARGFGPLDEPGSDGGSGGTPDGLTIDAEGGVWVALWGGSAGHRYTPDAVLDIEVGVPTTHPTSCAFAGPELDELWIISSAQGAGRNDGRAGALYRCLPGIRGLEPLPYQG
jgi:sugar lactone lactonase YvrE